MYKHRFGFAAWNTITRGRASTAAFSFAGYLLGSCKPLVDHESLRWKQLERLAISPRLCGTPSSFAGTKVRCRIQVGLLVLDSAMKVAANRTLCLYHGNVAKCCSVKYVSGV